jgi:amino acid efflux transporter
MKKLSAAQGISIGIGSIMGSGILFLPSMTLQVGGRYTLQAWIFTMLLCLPGLYFFSKMVDSVQDKSGIGGFVSLGLGPHFGKSIPILLLGTVSIGMPSAAIIASKYVQNLLPNYESIGLVMPFLLVYLGVMTTIKGLNTGSFLNSLVAFLLFAVGIVILFLCGPALPSSMPILPEKGVVGFLQASVLSFWAFAGFENLTFLAEEFHNPKRDLVISAVVSLVLCGLLYYALTYVYGGLIPYAEISPLAGLAQLSAHSSGPSYMPILIALFAVFAVVINLVSWTAGVSRAIVSSAKDRMLPRYLEILNSKQNPARAALFLGLFFTLSLLFNVFFPQYFDKLLTVVSTNLLVLYLIGLIAFFKYTNETKAKVLSLLFILGICIVLSSSGPILLYPLILISGSVLYSKITSGDRND